MARNTTPKMIFCMFLTFCSSFSSSSTMALTSATEKVPSRLVSYLQMCSSSASSEPEPSMSLRAEWEGAAGGESRCV